MDMEISTERVRRTLFDKLLLWKARPTRSLIRLEKRNQPLVVYPFPFSSQNPYVEAVNRELGTLGAVVVPHKFRLEKIIDNLPSGAIIHFHWPSMLYASPIREIAEKRLALWSNFLVEIARSCRVVWTAHNVFPHENPFPDLDLKARQLLVAHCDHIVVHCRLAVDRLQAEFGVLPPVSILPHPNFLDEYPSPPDRTAARRVLRIPDSIFLFLMFGWLRDYKGFDTAIATFRKMQLPQVRLHIAGKKHKYFDLERVTSLAEGDPRITVVSESLPADAVSTLFGAADVSLHCFRNILTSGTVALAQSMGTAIIAPRIGCIQEMVSRSCGILYDPDDPSDLENAMLRVTEIDVEAMGNEGRKSIAHQTMQSFAKKLMNIYRSL
jgi:beta-1,4-mannosyltransferase